MCELRGKATIGIATAAFGAKHGKIGVLQKLGWRAGVIGKNTRARARIGADIKAVDSGGLRQCLQDALTHLRERVGAGERRHQHGKLVAAKPCNEVTQTRRLFELRSHGAQQFVAERVTVRIIDRLEMIEIEKHQRDFAAVDFRGVNGGGHRLL